ncbi:hypothetical protein BG452_38745 [Streptomyces sp. CBMA123]|nr:hypothetical protein [Streptomyces sp. CBMA123]
MIAGGRDGLWGGTEHVAVGAELVDGAEGSEPTWTIRTAVAISTPAKAASGIPTTSGAAAKTLA